MEDRSIAEPSAPAPSPSGKLSAYVWPCIGLAAVLVSSWLLWRELKDIGFDDLQHSMARIGPLQWWLSALGALLAYAALAAYDRIALLHLGRVLPWRFIALASFAAYALSHSIGAPILSGAVVRYRAYGSRGLSGAEIGVLIALCSLTFGLGVVIVAGLVLLLEPDLGQRFGAMAPIDLSAATGAALLLLVAAYCAGSLFGLRPRRLGPLLLVYPRPPVVARQLLIGPVELVGAAAILYFALPEAGNPGFPVVLGVFVAAFSLALVSHAPGGLGVLELAVFAALPEIPEPDLLAALIVFRLFYLVIPLAVSILIVIGFERAEYRKSREPR